jgi:lambda repressor-like predicted transcriptional regulator
MNDIQTRIDSLEKLGWTLAAMARAIGVTPDTMETGGTVSKACQTHPRGPRRAIETEAAQEEGIPERQSNVVA